MAEHSDPETTRFPAVPDPVPAAETSRHAPKKGENGTSITIAILVVLLLIIVGTAAWLLLGFGNNNSSDNSGDSSPAAPSPEVTVAETAPSETAVAEQTVVTTEAPAETTEESPVTSEPAGRPVDPELPSDANPANEAARANTPAGNLNNVYTGSGATSPEFAASVRDGFVSHYLATDQLNGQIDATSPVTGNVYSMSCEDNGEYVTCTGGNNAVVYIS